MDQSTYVRVDARTISRFIGFDVKYIGSVRSINQNAVSVEGPDSQIVQVITNNAGAFSPNMTVEVTGKVVNEREIHEMTTSLLNGFDLQAYGQMLEVYHRNSDIFY